MPQIIKSIFQKHVVIDHHPKYIIKYFKNYMKTCTFTYNIDGYLFVLVS